MRLFTLLLIFGITLSAHAAKPRSIGATVGIRAAQFGLSMVVMTAGALALGGATHAICVASGWRATQIPQLSCLSTLVVGLGGAALGAGLGAWLGGELFDEYGTLLGSEGGAFAGLGAAILITMAGTVIVPALAASGGFYAALAVELQLSALLLPLLPVVGALIGYVLSDTGEPPPRWPEVDEEQSALLRIGVPHVAISPVPGGAALSIAARF